MTINIRANRRLTIAEGNENFRVLRGIAPPTLVENDDTEIANTTRGRWKSIISAAPSSLGSHDSVLTAFDGDLSKVQIAMEHRITGTTTLGQPASDYLFTPEAYPFYMYLYNSSGHNESTSLNDGRTAAVGINIGAYQTGQGDLIPFRSSVYVTGAKVGATSFLANPAGSVVCGGVTAGADGVFLQPQEFVLRDEGYDVAAVGPTVSMYRTENTGALDAFWCGFRSQSKGADAVDIAYSVFGPHTIGLDMTTATIGTAAIALKADQKIYGDASAADWRKASTFPNTYISYASSGSSWHIVNGGNPVVQISSTICTIAGSGGLLIGNTGALRLSGANQFTTGTSSPTFSASNKPGSTTATGPATWMRVEYGASTGYIPIWAS